MNQEINSKLPASAKIPAKTSPAQATNSLKAQRPATAKAQVEQKKAEMPGRTNQRSPTKQVCINDKVHV